MAGKFIAVVGASGVGKDALLNAVKPSLMQTGKFYFPVRYITRAPDETGESHYSISNTEFVQRVRDDRFSLWWAAHDLHFALPDDVYDALRADKTVVANISRRSVQEAHDKFPDMEVIEIVASAEICRNRLVPRGREDEAEIMVRQFREIISGWADGLNLHTIKNEAALSTAASELHALLNRISKTPMNKPLTSDVA